MDVIHANDRVVCVGVGDKPWSSPDYNDYLSTWVEYKNFYDELSLSRLQKDTQLKNGDTVLMKLW